MEVVSQISSLSATNKVLISLAIGLIIWVGFRYLIHIANKSYKKSVSELRHKPNQLDRLKVMAGEN